jgi:hypothetical protein
MVTLPLYIVITLGLAVGLVTLIVGEWRHHVGSRFAAELHRQLAPGRSWVGSTLVVVRLRTLDSHGRH